jgi:hypothetical protein
MQENSMAKTDVVTTPSNEIDTVAYAVNLWSAATVLSKIIPNGKHHPLSIAFFLLIGFSIENALKAVIEYKKPVIAGGWSRSHDLTRLRQITEDQGFIIANASVVRFIDALSPLHREHQFRYPQKAGIANLIGAQSAAQLVDELLNDVFEFVDSPDRLE